MRLVDDRLSKVLLGVIDRPFTLKALAEDEKLSDIGTKQDWFFIVPAPSLILYDFFIGILRELGITLGQLTLNSWKILTAFYVGCHERNKEKFINVRAFLRCYYLQAKRLSDQYYLCPYDKNYHFVENVWDNFEDKDLIFILNVSVVVFLSQNMEEN